MAVEGIYRRLDDKDLLSKAAQLQQSEVDRHAVSIACDRALADRNAAVADHALLMSASTRYDVHVTGVYGRLRREHQEVLLLLSSNTDTAVEDIRLLSSFIAEVRVEDAARRHQGQPPPIDVDNVTTDTTDQANREG